MALLLFPQIINYNSYYRASRTPEWYSYLRSLTSHYKESSSLVLKPEFKVPSAQWAALADRTVDRFPAFKRAQFWLAHWDNDAQHAFFYRTVSIPLNRKAIVGHWVPTPSPTNHSVTPRSSATFLAPCTGCTLNDPLVPSKTQDTMDYLCKKRILVDEAFYIEDGPKSLRRQDNLAAFKSSFHKYQALAKR